MKKVKSILSYFIIASLLFSSCNDVDSTKKNNAPSSEKYSSWSYDIKVIEIDSCEYVCASTGTINGGLSIVHKQNCKYCAARLLSKKQ